MIFQLPYLPFEPLGGLLWPGYNFYLGIKFVSSSNQPLLPDGGKKNEEEKGKNADEIDIGDESEDDHDEVDINIAKQMVPSAVFGKLDKDNE